MNGKTEMIDTSDDEGLRLSNQLCFATYSTAQAFNRVYKSQLDRLGLTYPQFLVMLVLWEEDGVAVKDIGQRLNLDSGTLTPLLKRLEAAGVVRRARDPKDERQVRISLTEKGRALKGDVAEARRHAACATGLSPDQIRALKEEMTRLRDSLNDSPS